MDNAANLQEGDGANPAVVTGGVPPVAVHAIRAQHPPIPPTPFFHGYGGTGNQMPFLYPHSYMPPIPGFGYGAPPQGPPVATIDLTEGSQKHGPQDFGIDHSKSNKEKKSCAEETGNCGIGRRCGSPKDWSSLEGPLGHSSHFTSG